MFASLIIVALGVGGGVPSQPCRQARTTVQMEECLKRELTAADQRLTRLEKQVRDDLSRNAAAQFDSAAAGWRAYREQECRAVYEASSGGTIAASALLGCKIELANSRRSMLARIYSTDR